jgi:hypothetical protein
MLTIINNFMNKPLPHDKRSLIFGGAGSIKDPEITQFLSSIKLNIPEILNDASICNVFCEKYYSWIQTSKLNTFYGLDQFQEICYTNGTTESFDKFHNKNHNRRFRCFRGEYMYHTVSWRSHNSDWKFLEDDEIRKNDAVIISYPFSDLGDKHPLTEEVLRQCEKLNVPVLIDCVYFGTCCDINFDLSYNCITDVTFSLSKLFDVANARIGIRLSKLDDDDPLFVVNKINYTNRIGAYIGLQLINQFSPDFISLKYKDKQLMLCNDLSLIPSKCIFFGIGDEKWNEYNRGSSVNRLSFHKLLHKSIEELKHVSQTYKL